MDGGPFDRSDVCPSFRRTRALGCQEGARAVVAPGAFFDCTTRGIRRILLSDLGLPKRARPTGGKCSLQWDKRSDNSTSSISLEA